MFGKLVGASIGRRIAGRNRGAKGALMGVGAATLARRGLGPLGAALALGWGAKKLYEWNRRRRPPTFPADVVPGERRE